MIKPIKTETQYEDALEHIFVLMQNDIVEGSDEEAKLEVLTLLVKEYERHNYPIDPPTPIEAIKFRLDQLGMKESDLNKILGNRSRKSDILSGRRKLSLSMIRALHQKLNISAETLISSY